MRNRGRVVGVLAPFFDRTIASRGVKYFQRGAVEAVASTPSRIDARVSGTETYTTGLCCEGERHHQTLYLWCDCPFVATRDEPCKHLWAAVQLADALGALGALENHPLRAVRLAADPHEFIEQSQRPSGPAKSRRGNGGTSRATPRAGPAELLCAIDAERVRSSGQVDLSVWVRPQGGTYEPCGPKHLQMGEFGKDDQWLLDRLPIRSVATGLFPLARSETDVTGFLEGLCRRRRLLYWPDHETAGPNDCQPLSFDRGPGWRLRLLGVPSGGALLLEGELFRSRAKKEEARPLLDAEFLLEAGVVAWSDRLAKLSVPDRESWEWIELLRRDTPVMIVADEVESFLDSHLAATSGPELVLPGELRLQHAETDPRPWLLLNHPSRGTLRGHVELEYGSRRVQVPHIEPVVVDLQERRLYRQEPSTERRIAEQLLASGFAGVALRATGSEIWEPETVWGPSLTIAAEDAPEAITELLRRGWRVMANGKPYVSMSRFNVRIGSGQNWFELSGSVDFEGKVLGLPELLRAVRRGERLVELGDGSVGMLPQAWLTRLGILGMQNGQGDQVIVPRSQVLLLDEVAATDAGFSTDAAFDRLRQEIQSFQTLAPADIPSTFRGELRDYQRRGLAWLELLGRLGFGGCLADDMGLGKTVQILALLVGNYQRRRAPSLVVAPSSVVFNWVVEAERFTPSLRVVAHTGPTRAPLEQTLAQADVIVTSYALLRIEAPAFAAAEFDYVILDEAQAIKNQETETAKVARTLTARSRLTVTGTPIENHLGELASQLEFLNPGMLGSSPRLASALLSGSADVESLALIQRAVKPFLLRRTKREVARELPERIEQNVFIELRRRERRRYDELLQHYRQRIDRQVASVGLARSTSQVLEALLRLRQAACHPGLLDARHSAERSAKLDRAVEEITRIALLGERCLVFSQFTTFLALLRQRLDDKGIGYEYLDGRSRGRRQIVERFQRDDGPPVFLISLLAGGVGLNLTAAEHVLLLDPWWNPAVEAQAIDRTHRIGQTRTVLAYRFIARGTVEEKVLALQEKKRALAEAILGQDAGLGGKLTRADLEAILG